MGWILHPSHLSLWFISGKNHWRNPKSTGKQQRSGNALAGLRRQQKYLTVVLLRVLSPMERREKKIKKNLSNSIKSSCVKTSTLNSRTEDSRAHSFPESVLTQQNATTNTDKIKIFFFSNKDIQELTHDKGKFEKLTRLHKTHLKLWLKGNRFYLVPQKLITQS